MPGPNGEPIAGDLPHQGPDGKWYNWDGSPLSDSDKNEIINSANGKVPAGTPDPNSVTGTSDLTGTLDKQITERDPAGSIDTTNPDAQRARSQQLIQQLQQQAATGNGSWQKTLETGTNSANAAAQSLGQMPGQGYAQSLHNIGNARAGNNQRAVGQENILRAKSQAEGQKGLADALSQQGAQDINQAAANQEAKQSRRGLNTALQQKNAKQNGEIIDTAVSAAGSLFGMSDGGEVPGEPKVFGDSEVNDTVPAKLSPGEIVIPRSHTGSLEAEMAFLKALHASAPHEGQHNFGIGGLIVGDGAVPEKAGVENGGALDSKQFDATRAQQDANAKALQTSAAGAGPSAIPQQQQNATDSALMAAMQAQASGRARPGLPRAAGAALQESAGQAGEAQLAQQHAGQGNELQAALSERQQALAMSHAQQQAAFQNSLLNSGIGIDQMGNIKGIANGAGQAASAYASAAGNNRNDFSKNDSNLNSFDQGTTNTNNDGGADQWENPFASGGVVESPNDAWANKMSEATASATKENADFKAKRQRGDDAVNAEKSYQSAPNDAWEAKMHKARDSATAENYDFADKRSNDEMAARKSKALVNALRASR